MDVLIDGIVLSFHSCWRGPLLPWASGDFWLNDVKGARLSSEFISKSHFVSEISAASSQLALKKDSLNALALAKDVLIYAFGACGKHLAGQLRELGVNCVIYDNSLVSRAEAVNAGFETATRLDQGLPMIVAAGQNQISILNSLGSFAYNLVEGLFAFDLLSSYGKARAFSNYPPEHVDVLYDLYQRLEQSSRAEFLSVLLFRASLEVGDLASKRTPVSQMWIPPSQIDGITSFCDVGAYDGDTLATMKAAFPNLKTTFSIEPNSELATKIDETAAKLELENRTFVGVAWDRKTKLNVECLPNGMMVVRDDPTGSVAADTLDRLTDGRTYDYVKFDVEGAEVAALDGARSVLERSRCVSVASYHFPDDIVRIPNHLAGLLRDKARWRICFRHYSECFEDSIFYVYN